MDPDQTAPWEQSGLGPYCLQYNLPKNIRRREQQMAKVVTGGLRVNNEIHAQIQRAGGGGQGVSQQYWSGSPEKPPSYPASIQCRAICCPPVKFRWWADNGPLLVVFGSSHPSST